MATHQPGDTGTAIHRSIASVGTTSGSAALTAPVGSFKSGQVGQVITGTGIPASTTISAVVADGSGATMSANATATGTITATLGNGDGFMVVTGEPMHKTNDTAITGTGYESPFHVVGATGASAVTRGTVDTRNATNVGAATGPDTEAPRVWEPA